MWIKNKQGTGGDDFGYVYDFYFGYVGYGRGDDIDLNYDFDCDGVDVESMILNAILNENDGLDLIGDVYDAHFVNENESESDCDENDDENDLLIALSQSESFQSFVLVHLVVLALLPMHFPMPSYCYPIHPPDLRIYSQGMDRSTVIDDLIQTLPV